VSAQYTLEDFWAAIKWLCDEGFCEMTYDPKTGEEMIRIAPGAEDCEV